MSCRGSISLALAWVTSFTGLIIARFALGVAEGIDQHQLSQGRRETTNFVLTDYDLFTNSWFRSRSPLLSDIVLQTIRAFLQDGHFPLFQHPGWRVRWPSCRWYIAS